MLILIVLFACSAEFLNIPIPPNGVQSVHQEDIKRDIWAIENGHTSKTWWKKRVSQLGGEIVMQENFSCLLHEGEKNTGLVYWTSLDKNDLGIRLATILSLAKASHRIDLKLSYR